MGSLMKRDWEKEIELKQMLIKNLALPHLENARTYDSSTTYAKLHDEISKSYIKHHASTIH